MPVLKENKVRIRIIWSLILAGGLLWLGSAWAAPWLSAHGCQDAHWIYAAYRPICHQIEERCLFVYGHPTAACARCMGIYSGFVLGTLLYPVLFGFRRPSPPPSRLFLLLTAPIGLDTMGNLLGLWQTAAALRFGLGIIWGLILPFYLLAGLCEIPWRFSGFHLHSRRKNS
jgi:uncharacterized membrane protein